MAAQSPTSDVRLARAPWFILSLDVTLQTMWRGRVRLLVITAIFAGLGILVAVWMQPEFVSEAKIMPEMSSGSGDVFKRLASVAGFAGVDFSETESVDAVRPDLYPNVLQSTPFILYLMNQRVVTKQGLSTTVGELLSTQQGWSLPRLVSSDDENRSARKAGKAGVPVELTARQKDLADDISRRVSARLDTRSGIIGIAAKMPDAHVAAQVAQLAMEYLTRYVTSYRTEKARQDLNFYRQRLAEARGRYQAAQFNVFQYNDQHKYVVVQAATMDKQRMDAELSIAQTVYTELSRQYEQAKLKVQERTPVFKVLEPPQVPLKRVSPKRTVTVLLVALGGFLLGTAALLGQQADLKAQLVALIRS
ncbi:lipopolysaccharide biosynthesis protein [Spirosoma fluminis]